jgi:hypothetical protein
MAEEKIVKRFSEDAYRFCKQKKRSINKTTSTRQ